MKTTISIISIILYTKFITGFSAYSLKCDKEVLNQLNNAQSDLLKGLQNTSESAKNDLENLKILLEISIKIFKDEYDNGMKEISDNLKTLDDLKSEIKQSIIRIQEYSWNETDVSVKIEGMKHKKNFFMNMKNQSCAGCEGFLDEDQVDFEILSIENQITEIENKFDKRVSEKELKELNEEEIRDLNDKYVDLIDVYEREVEELRKKEKLEAVNSIISEKWKLYALKIENLHKATGTKIKNLINELVKISESIFNKTDDNVTNYRIVEKKDHSYIWKSIDKSFEVPLNAVIGGNDIDNAHLYVIRVKSDTSYLYGKYAKLNRRNDAYVTKPNEEIGIRSFEILTAANYKWCNAKYIKENERIPSVCRAAHKFENSYFWIPGTLLVDGKCRIGWAWKVFVYSENVHVLSFSCP